MFKKLLSADPIYPETAIALVRITTGLFMIYHGWEVFDNIKMAEYAKWMKDLGLPSPSFISYIGKGIELVSGIFLFLGLFTRLAVIPLACTMAFICFGIGKGRIFYEEQHPFMFILLAFLFFFTGPGKWSFDNLFFSKIKAGAQINK